MNKNDYSDKDVNKVAQKIFAYLMNYEKDGISIDEIENLCGKLSKPFINDLISVMERWYFVATLYNDKGDLLQIDRYYLTFLHKKK